MFYQDTNKRDRAITTGKILEENLLQSALHQRLGEEFNFQQGDNLQQGQIYTVFAYQKDSECSSVAKLQF